MVTGVAMSGGLHYQRTDEVRSSDKQSRPSTVTAMVSFL
jgi:hypothetical protein